MKQKKVALKILDAQFLDFNTGNELLDTAMFDMFLSLEYLHTIKIWIEIRERQRQGVLINYSKKKPVVKILSVLSFKNY
ncbi:hypothetical protein EfmAA94_30320 (plasmid) [Enterococcus faecium]|nr:hypothetical protein EfmAA94_30320 [Enterococcus faecium]